jgi:hypothetical protein
MRGKERFSAPENASRLILRFSAGDFDPAFEDACAIASRFEIQTLLNGRVLCVVSRPYASGAQNAPRCHPERSDGSAFSYPRGKKQIPRHPPTQAPRNDNILSFSANCYTS